MFSQKQSLRYLWHGRCSILHGKTQFFALPSIMIRSYSKVSNVDISAFKKIVGETGVISDAESLAPYNVDWMKKYKGNSPAVILPKSTQQVSSVLRYCNLHNIPVVPQGGNTGLVGGSVAVDQELVLSTSRMNKVITFDSVSGVLVCESGCILEELDNYLNQYLFCMPLDLGAKGTCQIGGNVSSNAGGLRFIRYGSLRSSVLGLEVVLSDGTVLDLLNPNHKDNTGYDLKQLFIGAEGTLGVITKIAIATSRKPVSQNVAIINCPNFSSVIQLYSQAKIILGETLSAMELMDSKSILMVKQRCPHVKSSIQCDTGTFAVLLETSGSCADHDMVKMNMLFEEIFKTGTAVDGILAQDLTQIAELWSIREHIPVASSTGGYQYKYDVSVPLSRFYELVTSVQSILDNEGFSEDAVALGYGHLGDGNLHLNVVCKEKNDKVLSALEPFVFEWVVGAGGSISAEHGIGQHKRNYLALQKGPAAIKLMSAIKKSFDPKGILNPWKVLPDNF